MHVIDVEAEPFYGGFFRHVVERLRELAGRVKGVKAAQIFAPPDLVPQLASLGIKAQAFPEWYDAEASLAFAGETVSLRRVAFCREVVDKMKSHPIGAALSFKAADPVETALREALVTAIALKFDLELKNRPRPAA